ncbi:MAG: hypothetical protein VKN72_25085, partial [Nostocales cyanobacterium 94392]|nr:hypothetical protein [Nostocales cyanobacterium 94392]
MYFKTLITKSILVSSLLLVSSPAIAQTIQDKPNPNLDRFPQPIPNPQPLPTEEPTISPPQM